MLQRIGLEQAIVHEPDLIFLDEPTSGLDPMGRLMVRDVLRAERDRGATVFFNSHLLSEIEVTCDRVAFITILTSIDTVAGELSSGTIQAIATKPISRSQLLLGKFIGFAGMIIVYVAVTFGATVVVAHSVTGVLPQHPVRGLLLIIFECLVALSLTFMFGTWVSTLTNGIIVLGLQAVTFVGGWLEQVSGFSQSARDLRRRLLQCRVKRGTLSFSGTRSANRSSPHCRACTPHRMYGRDTGESGWFLGQRLVLCRRFLGLGFRRFMSDLSDNRPVESIDVHLVDAGLAIGLHVERVDEPPVFALEFLGLNPCFRELGTRNITRRVKRDSCRVSESGRNIRLGCWMCRLLSACGRGDTKCAGHSDRRK
ncbi:MAG: ABC transporter permease subunit [Gemmatimonadaceae bacterium]